MRLSAIIKTNSRFLQRCQIFGTFDYQNRTVKIFDLKARNLCPVIKKDQIDPKYFITLKQYLDEFTIFSNSWSYDTEYLNWLIKQEIDAENIWVDGTLSTFMHRSLYSDPYGI